MSSDKRGYAAAAAPYGEGGAPPDAGPAKQQKVDINPLTGLAYSRRFYELLERRQKLPAWGAREEFLKLIQGHQVVALAGETGSGKSTQLPQILLDAGFHVQNGQIKALACTQPQSVAAMCVAQRVADELEVQLGTYVGYSVRFEDKSSVETLLKFLTDEALLRELLLDPKLERYSVIILDEAHERTVSTDVLFGLLGRVLKARPELKLVVMSATEDLHRVQTHFGGAPLLRMPGRSHPVDVHYMATPEKDYLKVAIRTVVQIHHLEPEGDILLLLCDEAEVELACTQLKKESARFTDCGDLVIVPLYLSLSLAQQQKVFEAAPGAKVVGGRAGRKVVVATGIAETSVAIDNIVYVVDPGFARQRVYNPRLPLETSLVLPLPQPMATRRAAVAGRTRPGKCFRLYEERAFKQDLPEVAYPELLRSDLGTTVLMLKRLGIDDILRFEFVDPPSPEALMRAIENLSHLGFVDDEGSLTEAGEQAAKFPLEPQLARMLIESPKHRCSNEALSIAAMLSVLPVFSRPSGSAKAADEARGRFAHLDGDHLTLLNVFHAYKQQMQDGVDTSKFCGDNFLNPRSLRLAEVARMELKRTMDQLSLQMVSTDFQDKEYYPNIRRCIVSGFFMQVARLEKERSGIYQTVQGDQEATLHPFNCLQHKPEWIVYHEHAISSKQRLRTVTQIRAEWLPDLAPRYFEATAFPKSQVRAQLERALAAKRKQSP